MPLSYNKIVILAMMMAFRFVPEAGAIPCGLKEVLGAVGSDEKAFSPKLGTPKEVYDTFFFPTSYPFRKPECQ